ncbi:putative phosphomannomutase [Cenococcum geophilum 1.58]|uniref:putative phosphomannomutase n=1 Tax=Cenococcum geophilum 1.58 TaxID=794803 RepID=UPI00358ED2B6|nr:putative phosphomannomutase [Cenococcum geophilum 1.58]
MTQAGSVYPPLEARPMKNTICLFDVDKTLVPARRTASLEMQSLLSHLHHKCAIGYEQLSTPSAPVTSLFDFCFAENGLAAFKMGVPLSSTSFIDWIGETKYKALINWVLKYIADLDIPVKRGTFVEFRSGMVNISPIGRNAGNVERDEFQRYDKEHGIRKTMVEALKRQFPDLGLTYSIGGQISFDAFPVGWDETYCLRHVEAEKERRGDDHELYEDERTIGHTVANPEDTMRQPKELFDL